MAKYVFLFFSSEVTLNALKFPRKKFLRANDKFEVTKAIVNCFFFVKLSRGNHSGLYIVGFQR